MEPLIKHRDSRARTETRILFWTAAFWPRIGGVELLGAKLLLGLRERGYQFEIITTQDSPDLAAYEQFQGVPLHRFPFHQSLTEHDAGQVLRICRQVQHSKRAFQPDLVHIYDARVDAFFCLRTEAAWPAPILLTMQNPPLETLLLPGTVYGTLLRAADGVTTPSAAVRQGLLLQAPEMAPRLSMLPHALALPTLQPAPLPFDPPRLLCLGRLVPDKGFDTAIAAFALLAPRFPHTRLVIAGDGPARRDLEQQARALQLGASVSFTGSVPEVQPIINNATVVIMPSRHNEGFGLVALEAAQLGRPVVATREGGLPEVVLDQRTGLLVDRDDPHALAQAISMLLAQPDLARRLGHAACHRARTAFRWDDHVDAYDHLYQRLTRRA